MPTSTYEFKAAAYLNNAAVSLLQRRSYVKAVRTLSDAISIIKDASSRQAQAHCTSQRLPTTLPEKECFAAVQERLQNAAQRLSHPAVDPIQKATNIGVVSDNESPPSFLGATSRSLENVTYLIRIDSAEFEEAPCRGDLAVTTSIIFYNFAIAYRCLASLASKPTSYAEKHDNRALHLLHLAYSASCSVTSQFSRIQLVNLLVLHNLVELSHQEGFDERRRVEYATRLGQLRHVICKLEALEGKFSAKVAPAA
jgi:hypothetical protein